MEYPRTRISARISDSSLKEYPVYVFETFFLVSCYSCCYLHSTLSLVRLSMTAIAIANSKMKFPFCHNMEKLDLIKLDLIKLVC